MKLVDVALHIETRQDIVALAGTVRDMLVSMSPLMNDLSEDELHKLRAHLSQAVKCVDTDLALRLPVTVGVPRQALSRRGEKSLRLC